MKRKTFFALFLMFLLTSVGATAQTISNKTWVSLADSKEVMISKNIPIYDIRVNIKSKQKEDKNAGVIFRNRDFSQYLFLNTHDWKYNFDKVKTKNQYKLSTSASDNDGFKHPVLNELRNEALYLSDIEINALCSNIQVLIKNDDAIIFYRKKAENGDIKAMCFMGDYLSSKRPNEAFTWYKRAADSGNEMAKIKVAECYIDGIGVEKNMTKAETMLLMLNSNLPEVKMLMVKIQNNPFDERIRDLINDKYLPACVYEMKKLSYPSYFFKPLPYKDLEVLWSDPELHTSKNGKMEYEILDMMTTSKYWEPSCKNIFCSENTDIINDLFSDKITRNFINGYSNDTRIIKAVFLSIPSDAAVRLLKSGECDFLWIMLLYDHNYGPGRLDYGFYHPGYFDRKRSHDRHSQYYEWDLGVFEIISKALGFKYNRDYRLSDEDVNSVYKQLFFKYCDIALKPSTKNDYFSSIVYLIMKAEYVNAPKGKNLVFLNIVKGDPECKKKMLEVLKKGRQLGDKLCIENYETFFLN